MNYSVSHTTTYEYQETVAVCQNVAHLAPRIAPWQTCSYHRLLVRPMPALISRRTDYFGNPVTYFSISEGHRKLTITSNSRVDVRRVHLGLPLETPAWETVREALPRERSRDGLDTYQFCFDSPLVRRSQELRSFTEESFPSARPILDGVVELTARIHKDFVYDAQATTVQTPLEEVFANRRGVCQDLAHIEIGCLRSLGLAARYVSGFLRTLPPPGKPRLVGADASHAWLAVFCGPLGWIDLDPTNNAVVGTDHITVAWGRDYSDVCPIHGMFVGGGQHAMSVSADVEPVDYGQ